MSTINEQKGFTLLETLVAISILMVAVAAPITIAQKGLSSAVYSKNQMIASYLAQDAIEYVKNQRDLISINSLDPVTNKQNFDWHNLGTALDLCKAPAHPSGCDIDTITGDVRGFSTNVPLQQDTTNKFYGHVGNNTIFKRRIIITLDPYTLTADNPDEAMIDVEVSWGDISNPTDPNNVEVKTLIYNY